MSELVFSRFGNVEVHAPSDHVALFNIFSEMQIFVEKIGAQAALDGCDIRFLYSADMFSRILNQVDVQHDGTARTVIRRSLICVDLVGIHFFHCFVTNLFGIQRSFSEYVEGALTGTVYAIDQATFMLPFTGLDALNAPISYLENERAALLQAIRNVPDEVWGNSLIGLLTKLRHNMLLWLHDTIPREAKFEDLSSLVYRVIFRFAVGHELGHRLRDSTATHAHWAKKIDGLQLIFPDHDVRSDIELWCDSLAIDYCLFHFKESEAYEFEPKMIVMLLLVLISLFDAISISPP